jgi:hypothetical protein
LIAEMVMTHAFAGSDGGRHWAIVASLVATAKLNGVEPLAWLTDVLERMVSGRTKAHELERCCLGRKAEQRELPSMPERCHGQTTFVKEILSRERLLIYASDYAAATDPAQSGKPCLAGTLRAG